MSDFDTLADLLPRHREAAMLALLDLPSGSVSIVAGGYKGDTAAFLRSMHKGRVFAFEPQQWAAALLQDRFSGDGWVTVRGFGLGSTNAEGVDMGEYWTDACSFLFDPKAVRAIGTGDLRDVAEVWKEEGIGVADLLLLNMEGYEYVLLPYMADRGLLACVGNIVLQIHEHVAVEGVALGSILRQTHDLVADFGPAWQWWRRKGMAVRA